MNFSRSGRQIIQPEQKNQIAANALASMASARAARKELIKTQLIPQLQANPELIQQIQTVLKTQDDLDILNELFRDMGMGSRGGKRSKKSNKRRKTLRRRMTKRRRRY
jgi:hypothetical protein